MIREIKLQMMNPMGMNISPCRLQSFSTTSFAGGERSGLAVVNPRNDQPRLHIRVYTDGVLVDGVDFRSFENPENVEFLSILRSGEVPPALVNRVRDSGGSLNMELVEVDRKFDKNQDMVPGVGTTDPPKPQNTLFHGSGNMLATPSTNLEPSREVPADFGYPDSDMSKPTTSIQLRLPSGTRLVRTFNVDKPGSTIIVFLADSLGLCTNNIGIITGFPPRRISHSELSSKTISELGLSNSAVSVVFN